MKKIIGGKLYDTETATSIASNEFADGSNRLQRGRGTTLYKTAKGNFFALYETCWQGEHDTIQPLSSAEASALYEELNGDADNWPEEFGTPEQA